MYFNALSSNNRREIVSRLYLNETAFFSRHLKRDSLLTIIITKVYQWYGCKCFDVFGSKKRGQKLLQCAGKPDRFVTTEQERRMPAYLSLTRLSDLLARSRLYIPPDGYQVSCPRLDSDSKWSCRRSSVVKCPAHVNSRLTALVFPQEFRPSWQWLAFLRWEPIAEVRDPRKWCFRVKTKPHTWWVNVKRCSSNIALLRLSLAKFVCSKRRVYPHWPARRIRTFHLEWTSFCCKNLGKATITSDTFHAFCLKEYGFWRVRH